ncbi:hypothetical protein [Paracoccus benzoatiresistens]|uniref:Uncharacterized protein n=1 Tax=Paracoccus benzoatiresistens TaxID=2997341 RepID=A0ABT4IZ00_9RHOB|nr:hypothetical protein [Paracoccus sp. EF6]MCZ0960090.1 hypothetical protein [Paracoccus sp. EF6]
MIWVSRDLDGFAGGSGGAGRASPFNPRLCPNERIHVPQETGFSRLTRARASLPPAQGRLITPKAG